VNGVKSVSAEKIYNWYKEHGQFTSELQDPETGEVFEVELEGGTVKSMRRVEE